MLGQGRNIFGTGVAEIDHHQRMTLGNAGPAQAKSLEARLLDQPAGRKLGPAIGLRKIGRRGESRKDRRSLIESDDRVLEKRTGIGRHAPIGQF
ncbi:hypothetical protein D3C87_1964470 [compost metagenome]